MEVFAIVGIATVMFFGGGALTGTMLHLLMEGRVKGIIGIPLAVLGIVIGMGWIPVISLF